MRRVLLIGLDSVSLPLVEHFIAEGADLPHLTAMLARGSSAEAMPELPAYTPTNWAALATGARPGTSGASKWFADIEGIGRLSTFDGRAISCETIFEAAARAGIRTLAVQYPGSYPRRGDGLVVAPLPRGLASLALAPGCEYVSHARPKRGPRLAPVRQAPRDRTDAGDGVSWLADVSIQASDILSDRSGLPGASRVGSVEDGNELAAKVAGPDGHTAATRSVPIGLRVHRGAAGRGRAYLDIGSDPSSTAVELEVGTWTPWLRIDVPIGSGDAQPASVRFKLRELSPEARRFDLVRSEVYPMTGFAEPSELEKILLGTIGPFFEHPSILHQANDITSEWDIGPDVELSLEEMTDQVTWLVASAKLLLEERGWDLYYLHWHFPDTILHHFLAAADRSAPGYRPELASFATRTIAQTLELADRLVGGLAALAGDDGYVFVVSDHGTAADRWVADVSQLLCEEGLAVRAAAGGLESAASKALPIGGLQIKVNVARDREGRPLDLRAYEDIQAQVIDALLDWREPTTGTRPVALALRREAAPLVGFWGPTAGDVLYCFNDGFAWPDPHHETTTRERSVRPAPLAPVGAHHGPQLPTAKSELSSNLALLLLTGPGVRRAHRWDHDRRGYPRLVDVVPTICELLGFVPPRQCQGAVLWELFEEGVLDRAT